MKIFDEEKGKLLIGMRDEVMICPKVEKCNPKGLDKRHCHPHQFGFDCLWASGRGPACEKFLGAVVKNERRIDDMSEGRELWESKATNA
jgi:hypothetical protein